MEGMQMKTVKVRVGYACINLSLKTSFKSYRLASVEKREKEKILSIIKHNFLLLKAILDYNVKHNIYVYRMSSDLVPFCTHPYVRELYINYICQDEEMMGTFQEISALCKQYCMRLSIHPGQYNVLSSPKIKVVKHSIEEINMQTEWVKMFNGQNVVIHVGGSYGDKAAAMERFKTNINYVDQNLISIENDDKIYNAEEVVNLCESKGLKWVYDYHHDRCHPSMMRDMKSLIEAYPPDKYHLSTGTPHNDSRSHADYISPQDYAHFTAFLESCHVKTADVIFEAKKKNKAIFHILCPCGEGYWCLENV